ncbi:YdeI/OmpD-associated family protein [Paenibacillus sambharensis]|uniref:YdeI/OmpD-associated family protein n=1 Tax=Paenibacillus sambharensis TaxID=1803190 RepID=UPI0011B79386|nr:YdeI/OmpD-associated family protein [Paenibacillus sambharensis]
MRKLRLEPGMKALIMNPPEDAYIRELGLAEEACRFDEGASGKYDFVMLFAGSVAELNEYAPSAVTAAKHDGLLWICYPKGSSGIKTDLNRDKGWEAVTSRGLAGIAQVAVDDTWTASRFRPSSAVASRTRPQRIPDKGSMAGSRAAAAEAETVPVELGQALAAEPEAAAFFDRLPASGRKEYIRWVKDAKREETRTRRIAESIQKLKQGMKGPYAKG